MTTVGFVSAGALLLALTLCACVGPTYIVQQYAGAPRPRERIAMLRLNGNDAVRLLDVDGENIATPLASDARLHIEMLPSLHTVTVADANAAKPRARRCSFEAEAGKVYRVVFEPSPTSPDGTSPRIHEVDRGSDVLARDVTVVAGAEDVRGPTWSEPPELLPPP